MKKGIVQQKAEGSITVFLSLILLIILSLLFTIIEGARVSTAKVYAERALTTAMDSVLAEYYGPLWEEYHIFGYDTGEGVDTKQKEHIADKLSSYMSYTFTPDKDTDGFNSGKEIELYDISADNISIRSETKLVDYEGQLLINEAVEYMKYRETGGMIEQLLGKLSLLETPEKVSYLMEEKQKAEEELVEIDQGVLELMQLLDGIATNQNGIEITKAGALKTVDYFIKKIYYEEVTRETVGINQDTIFQSQVNHYVNPNSIFNKMERYFDSIEDAQSTIEEAKLSMEYTQGEIEELQVMLSMLGSVKKDPEKGQEKGQVKDQAKDPEEDQEKEQEKEQGKEQEKEQIEALKNSILEMEKNLSEEQRFIEDHNVILEEAILGLRSEEGRITELVNKIKPLIEKAIACIDQILLKTEVAKPLLNQYEELLSQGKDAMDAEIYEGLEEDLKELKKYIDTNNNSYDFAGMKIILHKDLSVLNMSKSMIQIAEADLSNKQYQSSREFFQKAQDIMESYQINGLTLDYSTLMLDKSNQESPLKAVSKLLQCGVTGLVLDPDNISDAKLSSDEALPSEVAALQDDDTNFLSELSSFFEKANIGGKNSGLGSLFGDFGDGTKIASAFGTSANKAAERYLYQEYLKEHFGSYQAEKANEIAIAKNISNDKAADKEQKPSVLAYEQEYLLAGKASDQENLASIISRIVLIRTIFDFVSILGDKAIREEAKLVAISLVGFTGLPILISVTQILILLGWAFAEALLDTSALMMGKEVPIIKKTISMEFPELFLINREYMQKKSAKMADTKELSFTYQDYIRVFLLMKKQKDLAYRSMDLMQENIRLRYGEETFQIKNCLFGYDAKADFIIENKFTGFSFVQKQLNGSTGNFHFSTRASYSY